MSDAMEIPAFLRRTPKPTGDTMTAPAPAPAPPKPRQARKDAYCFTIRGKIPLDMANADSLAGAIKTAKAFEATLPADATCETTGTLGKL